MNGRKNWNIPKHVANFDIQTSPDGMATSISVTHPGSSSPFFKASVKPNSVLSSLAAPITTTFLGPYYSLMQPPLPAGPSPEDVDTETWAGLIPVMRGTASLRKLIPGLEERKVGDGKGFPALMPWTTALFVDNFDMEFGLPTFYDKV